MTTFPTTHYPWEKILLAGRETTAGTAVTTGLYLEECRSVDFQTQLVTEQEIGYLGAAVTKFDETLMQESSSGSFVLPFRNGGLGAALLLGFLGSGATVDSGVADPYAHTATTSPTTSRVDTWTFYQGMGDSTNLKQMPFGTPKSMTLASPPSGAATLTVNADAAKPAFVNKSGLTVAQYVGSTANYKKTRQQGNAMVLTLYNSAGSAYTCSITNINLTFTRNVGQVPNTNGTSPVDFPTGVIDVQGSISFRYDGSAAGTLHADFVAHNAIGDASHIHQVVWTDTDTHTLTAKFYPAYLANCRFSDGNEYITGDVDLNLVNDLAAVNVISPVITAIKQIIVTNAITGAMP